VDAAEAATAGVDVAADDEDRVVHQAVFR